MAQASSPSTARARALRRNATETEARMWSLPRDRRRRGYKFRWPVSVGRFVADFARYRAKLVIELDGSQHAGGLRDTIREQDLRRRGSDVPRVWNTDVFLPRDAVLTLIFNAIHERTGDPDALC